MKAFVKHVGWMSSFSTILAAATAHAATISFNNGIPSPKTDKCQVVGVVTGNGNVTLGVNGVGSVFDNMNCMGSGGSSKVIQKNSGSMANFSFKSTTAGNFTLTASIAPNDGTASASVSGQGNVTQAVDPAPALAAVQALSVKSAEIKSLAETVLAPKKQVDDYLAVHAAAFNKHPEHSLADSKHMGGLSKQTLGDVKSGEAWNAYNAGNYALALTRAGEAAKAYDDASGTEDAKDLLNLAKSKFLAVYPIYQADLQHYVDYQSLLPASVLAEQGALVAQTAAKAKKTEADRLASQGATSSTLTSAAAKYATAESRLASAVTLKSEVANRANAKQFAGAKKVIVGVTKEYNAAAHEYNAAVGLYITAIAELNAAMKKR